MKLSGNCGGLSIAAWEGFVLLMTFERYSMRPLAKTLVEYLGGLILAGVEYLGGLILAGDDLDGESFTVFP